MQDTSSAIDTVRHRLVGWLGLVWSALVIVIGLLYAATMMAIAQDQRHGGYCESVDHPGRCEDELLVAMPGLEITLVGGWGAVASAGLVRGRRWARPAIVGAFALLSVLVLAWPAIIWISDWPYTMDLVVLLAILGPPLTCHAVFRASVNSSR